MNLNQYKNWYVRDDCHLYITKIKQYDKQSINLFAKGLKLFGDLLGDRPSSQFVSKYLKFAEVSKKEKKIIINEPARLFLALEILSSDLVDLNHMRETNEQKYHKFQNIIGEYLEGKNYKYFIKKYTKGYLSSELVIHYRNFKQWFGKYGFCGFYKLKLFFLTQVGEEFVNQSDDNEITNALFLNQIKKLQIWNPTYPGSRYKELRVLPYYLILQMLISLEDNYFTKEEYVLFITKMKSHHKDEIRKFVNLIKKHRKLSNQKKRAYIREINSLDRNLFPDSARTKWEENLDSSGKEIPAFCYSNLTAIRNTEHGRLTVQLNDIKTVKKEINHFEKNIKVYEIENQNDWIRHHGSLEGLSIEDIIDIYLREYGQEETKNKLLKVGITKEEIEKYLTDRLLESEVEEYYCLHIDKIDKNLSIIKNPYGRQYSTPIGIMDLLCIDNSTGEYVVIEFKRGATSDETVGQILRYMGWAYINLSTKSTRGVKGVIVHGMTSNRNRLDHAVIGLQSDNLISTFEHPFNNENRPTI